MPEEKIACTLSFTDVIRVLRLIDEIPFRELNLELEGLKLRVVQDKELPLSDRHAAAQVTKPARAARSEPAPEPAPEQAVAAASPEMEGEPVLAPLAGTFYRSPLPGAPPFVEVGTAVKKGDVVGILEIMKLMNHVSAPCSGVITRICVKNEEFVEYGEVLALIDPKGAA